MGTVRASHLTSLSSSASDARQPSIFDILSQENLSSSIKPALHQLTKYLTFIKPKSFGRTNVKTGLPPSMGREKLASLIVLVLWPYVENKMNTLHERLKESYERRRWADIRNTKEKMKKFFVTAWPLLKTLLKGIKTIMQLTYILNRSSSHSPFLWLSGNILHSLTPEDFSQFEHVPMHLRKSGIVNRLWRFILGLPGVLSRLFGYGLFFVQFLDFMYNSDFGSQLTGRSSYSKAPPPPHQMISESNVLNLDTNKCPLCYKKRTNDTALFVSGYVFCYTCINKYVNTHHKCPVTGLPATNQHLIRLFV
ncbi:unnamed protein product [Caenorhabditis auriculariae]|uniref:Peroxisome assembly protein 12 n=1 Tax=Caenorhabditis auriculariae TaxID=2777116 RepID=A0A8S1H155_9PELO|nr:unnamed protein product [Caenorhabditis auriculariae]